MGLLSSLTPWDENTYGNNIKTLRVLIECEKGSSNKYEYDDDADAMVIVRQLDKHFKYPFSYGCVPQTLAEDGDNLDAIVITDEVVSSKTLLNCIPLAIVRMVDKGEQDDKLICVPFYVKHGEIDVHKIVEYLQNYKYPFQDGTVLTGIEGAQQAITEVERTHKVYLEKHQ